MPREEITDVLQFWRRRCARRLPLRRSSFRARDGFLMICKQMSKRHDSYGSVRLANEPRRLAQLEDSPVEGRDLAVSQAYHLKVQIGVLASNNWITGDSLDG